MRLIDVDALKQDLRKYQIESLIAHNEEKNVFDIINEQPTAYDVEKVVEALEKEAYNGFDITLSKATAIVKRGGVE